MSIDLVNLDVAEIHPAVYYALCNEARERGIPVSLDDDETPATVQDLVDLVRADREKHALREALRSALSVFGIANPEWVETVEVSQWSEWKGAHVALAVDVEDVGGPESGPSLSMTATQWVNVVRLDHGVDAYEFVFCASDDEHAVRVYAESAAQVASTLVGILRACGYESLS